MDRFLIKRPRLESTVQSRGRGEDVGQSECRSDTEAAVSKIALLHGVCQHHPYDIAQTVGKTLGQCERLKFLNETWKPSSNYTFPGNMEGKQIRKFNINWLEIFNWLAYSAEKGGSFCKYCVLFAPSGAGLGSQDLKKFVKHPLNKYKNAKEEFRAHAEKEYHKFSVLRAAEFVRVVESEDKKSVSVMLDKKKEETIEANRKRVKPIIKTVLFCARNNLPLRGHRDDGRLDFDVNKDDLLSGKQGIFRGLLAFRLDSGDNDLKAHLEISGEKNSMISKTIQNEIIESLGEVIRSSIISEVLKAKYFSILCDETTDISTKEQLSICLRYVNVDNMTVNENFIGFKELSGSTGLDIRNCILQELRGLGLDMQYLRGQGFDGGSNMSGKYIGVKALVLDEQPLAFYTHCFSHQLNLCISKSCNIITMKNMFGIVTSVATFVTASAKRVSALENIVNNTDVNETKKKKLKVLCPTRWVERHESLIVFKELFFFIIQLLEEMEEDSSDEVSSKAVALGAAMRRSDFIVGLETAVFCLSHTLKLSKFLQDPVQDLSTALSYISTVTDRFISIREKGNEEFIPIFKSSCTTATHMQEEIRLPRVCKRQTQRMNILGSCPEDYYRRTVFFPFLDHIITQLKSRFCNNLSNVMPIEGLIPSNLTKFSDDEILKAAEIYTEDFPATTTEIKAEISLWRASWAKCEKDKMPKNCIDTLIKCNEMFYPSIRVLLQIFATLPVTTASAERSFSTLRRLKTYIRNTMGETRLNGLALANIHKDRDISVDDVLNHFGKTKPRRLEMSNWSKD